MYDAHASSQSFQRWPIRLLTLTTLFPNSRQPRHGIFVANRLRRLCDTGRVEATVIAAVPWFPGVYRDKAAIPLEETIAGLQVRHPRFVQVPAVGMRLQPDSLARALLDDIRRSDVGSRPFDVIDAHYFYPDGVAAARVAAALDLPLVISARGSDINLIGDIAFARQRMLLAANGADALIAVSAALAGKMVALGMAANRVHVLRNGVDTELFAPYPRPEARSRLGLDARGTWVVGVGNLVREKGFDILIRAVSELPDTRLLIVGQGPVATSLRRLAHAVAPGRVAFRNNMSQAELRFAYAAGDVLGLPSMREGWPNVVLEAIACGTPVVASAVGGLPEILKPGAPGLLVGVRDSNAWSAALRSQLDARLSPETVRSYAMSYGWDEVVARQCDLYESISTGNASRQRRCA